MSAIANYLAEAALNHIFRGTAYTQPATLYVALFTTATNDDSGGTEVSGGSYARVPVACTTGQWSAPTGTPRAITNVNAITFPTATANWGTVTHLAIHDAPSGGNRLYHGALSASAAVASGQTLSIAAGQLALNLT